MLACFTGYALEYHQGLVESSVVGKDPSISEGFHALGPLLLPCGGALLAAILATVALGISWLWNKQPLFSIPHVLGLIFLFPLPFVLLT